MKTILITFSVTIAAAVLVAKVFLESILGAFGLAAVPIDVLRDLTASKQVVESMKKRHETKKANAARKLARKSGKKIAATGVAVATHIAAAVFVTMVTLEVADYCEAKRELLEDGNVLYGTQDKFDFAKCFEEAKEDWRSLLSQAGATSWSAVSNAFKSSAKSSAEKWAVSKDAALKALDQAGEEAGEFWDGTKSWVTR